MPPELLNQTKLDADEQVFFSRELEHIKARTYDIKYAELKARMLIPVSFEADTGSESITYQQYDQVGIAKVIANYASDFPRADIRGKEFTAQVRSFGSSYGYSVQEIRAARMKGLPLQQRKANAARRAIMQKENTVAFTGDSEHNLQGFLNHPNITEYTVPADGTGASKLFSTKTADQILRDLNGVVNTVVTTTLGVEQPDTLLLPLSIYTTLTTQRIADTDVTILAFFIRNSPYIKAVDWLNELETLGAGSTKRMIAYKRSPDALTLEVPQDFEQFPPDQKGMEFEIACHSRCGGVLFYYPLSAAFGDGI